MDVDEVLCEAPSRAITCHPMALCIMLHELAYNVVLEIDIPWNSVISHMASQSFYEIEAFKVGEVVSSERQSSFVSEYRSFCEL